MSNDLLLSPESSGAKRPRSSRLEILNRDIGIRQRRPRGFANEELRRALSTLDEMIVDLSIPEDMLADYISVQHQPGQKPFSQFVLHDDIHAALAHRGRDTSRMLRNIKEFCRHRRQAQFHRRYRAGENRPILISDGDSWFQFPVFLRDVTLQLSQDHLVWPLANAGDTLQHMVYGDQATNGQRYVGGLRDYGHQASAFLFSGGGNDVIGIDPNGQPAILSYVRPYQPSRSVEWHLDTSEYRRRIAFIEASLRHVVADVAARRPKLPVILHGYDYVMPYPRAAAEDKRNPQWTGKDHFIGGAVRNLGIHDPAFTRRLVRHLIDAVNAMQRRLAGGNVEGGVFPHVYHVDVRNTVLDDEWADEIHPTNSGYARVADRFRKVLSEVGIQAA